MLEQFKRELLNELKNARVNLSLLWLLEHYYKGTGSEDLDLAGAKTLSRRGFILLGHITESGKEFYEDMANIHSPQEKEIVIAEKPIEKVVTVSEDDDFRRLW